MFQRPNGNKVWKNIDDIEVTVAHMRTEDGFLVRIIRMTQK